MIPSILTSYTDRLSYRSGDEVRLFVSSPEPAQARIELVHLEAALDSPGKEQVSVVSWDGAATVDVRGQEGCAGSFMLAELATPPASYDGLTFGAFVRLDAEAVDDVQTVLAVGAEGERVALALVEGRPALRVGSEELLLDEALRTRVWYLVVGRVQSGRLHLTSRAVAAGASSVGAERATEPYGLPAQAGVVVGGDFPVDLHGEGVGTHGRAASTLTGRVSWPFVVGRVLEDDAVEALSEQLLEGGGAAGQDPVVAVWDLYPHEGEQGSVREVVGGRDGRLVNLPTRAVPGPAWRSRSMQFWEAPAEFSSAHFHATDVVDAGWSETLRATLPADLPSGAYALRITTPTEVDHVPVAVTPAPGARRERVLVVLPTFTYLAYANESLFDGLDASLTGTNTVAPGQADVAHVGNTTFGVSQYDTHRDGASVAFTSAARPIVNLRHDYHMWLSDSGRGLSAEMYLLEWLGSIGVAFDVITDLELHEEGAGLLAEYRVVVSGSHPEYYSGQMLDALETYRDTGGKIMYLGGNGYYWVTGVLSTQPLVTEIRRGHAGISTRGSEPGETTLVSTSEQGGLWRHRGRAPQKLVGIGMAAQGWGGSEPVHRTERSLEADVAWIFDGVGEDPIGAYGRVMGGAVGDELDRADVGLGTPHNAVVLASSRNHTHYYQRAIEEVGFILEGQHGGRVDPEVRGDLVYFTTAGGGAVFSAGSIAWSGALLENGSDNGVSRLTGNVLRRFAGLE